MTPSERARAEARVKRQSSKVDALARRLRKDVRRADIGMREQLEELTDKELAILATDAVIESKQLHSFDTYLDEKKLDPVGKEDGDIDNDGDEDSSDEYLKRRRLAISKKLKEMVKAGDSVDNITEFLVQV